MLLMLTGCPVDYAIESKNPLGAVMMMLSMLRAPQQKSSSSIRTLTDTKNIAARSALLSPQAPGARRTWAFASGPWGHTIEVYKMTISFPGAFTFNGFNASGSGAGTYSIVSRNDSVVRSFALRAIDADHAYVDLDSSGAYDPWDTYVTHSGSGGKHLFTIILADGGEYNSNVSYRNITDKGVLELASGILDNPVNEGAYNVDLEFTSVDPDTGNVDDGKGEAPQVNRSAETVNITSGAALNILTDATNYSTGNTQTLYMSLNNPGQAVVADIYLALMSPDGQTLSFLRYEPAGGGFSYHATATPLLSGLTIPNGISLNNIPVRQYTFSGAEASGNYRWYSALVQAGTFTLIGGIEGSGYRFTP